MSFARAFVAALGVVAVAAVSSMAAETPVTFTKNVAPIFYKNCVVCHYPKPASPAKSEQRATKSGATSMTKDPHGGAPMSLLDYQTAKTWAPMVRRKVMAREMPPWDADPRYGKFKNDPRLSDEDIKTIVAWVDAGAPEGDPKDLPPPPAKRAEDTGWIIGNGKPDLILSMEKPFVVPGDRLIDYQYFILDPHFTEDKWIQAAQVLPGEPSVVHHDTIFVMPPPGDKLEGKAGRPGGEEGVISMPAWQFKPSVDTEGKEVKYEGTEIEQRLGVVEVRQSEGLGGKHPEGAARLVKAGSKIVLQLHYNPNGKDTADLSKVGLVFAKGPGARRVIDLGIVNMKFTVPAGAPNYEVKAEATFLKDAQLLTFGPHLHYRGKDIEYRLFYPDGKSEILLKAKWDFFRPERYELAEPVFVPKGSKIVVTAHMDNSAANKNNPDPTVDVPRGKQSSDEMMNGHITALVEEDRPEILAAAAKQRGEANKEPKP